jgi:ribosomal-protein-alanine N-acetyltransferase
MKPTLPRIFSRKPDSSLTAHLETNRLIIRSINESDLSELIDLQSDEDVMKFVGAGVIRTKEKITDIHQNLLNLWKKGDPVGGYAICNKEDGMFMGMACLENVGKPGEAEVMAYLKPEFWRKGYGKEIGLGFIDCIIKAHEENIPMIIDHEPLTKLVATA